MEIIILLEELKNYNIEKDQWIYNIIDRISEQKDILYEIYRIQELIGIQKNIIKENKYINFLSDMIKDFIVTSKKAIPNVADEIMVGTIQIEKRIFDEIIEVLNNPQLYDVLGNAEKTIFARIVAQSPEIVDDIYKRILFIYLKQLN